MSWLISFVGSRIGRLVAGALAAIGTVLAIFQAGKRDARKDQKVKDLKSYRKTREQIDATKPSSDRNDALERLRDNNQLRDRDL